MSISSNRYVDIVSSVGGGDAVAARELLLRLYTINERVPTGTILNFAASTLETSLRDHFGSDSEEYKMASFYFGFISKSVTSPKNIQFARWADSDTAAQVFGSESASLDDLTLYAAADFDINLAGVTTNIVGLDFSLASAFDDVATELQTKIQAEGGDLSAVTVTFDATRGTFDFNTQGSADGEISFAEVTESLLDDLGWGSLASFSNGVAEETVTDVLASSVTTNNNFGSYVFIDTLSDPEIEEAAIFANGRNVEFQYYLQVLPTTQHDISDLIGGYASCGMVLNTEELSDEYPHLLPAALLASIDYEKVNAAVNFMYHTDARLSASVTNDTDADISDALSVNYVGQTQESGTLLSFFQRGVLTGGATAPKNMGVHANEQWLKSHVKTSFLNMFLAIPILSADSVGEAISATYLNASISLGLTNGTISVGKELTTTQKVYISGLTGDSKAYIDVQNDGYWYKITMDASAEKMSYLLIYSKRDSINKVEGQHSLI